MAVNRQRLAGIAAACLLALAGVGGSAHGAGIPVYDLKSDLNFLQQLMHMLTQIENQISHLQQLQSTYRSMTGNRGLGQLLRNPALNNYVPADVVARLDGVSNNGYTGLTAAAKVMRNAGMVYNCLNFNGTLRNLCQADLGRPYESRALLRQAMEAANGRMTQISGLMDAINRTDDPKSIQELNARIAAEQAALAHETSRVQMLQQLVENDQRIADARADERTREAVTRTRRIGEFLTPMH